LLKLNDVSAKLVNLEYKPPFEFERDLEFLRHRSIKGVERIDQHTYARTAQIEGQVGWLLVRHDPDRPRLQVAISESLVPFGSAIAERVRVVFDLDADPQIINSCLGSLALENPGLRLPGAFDGFEAAIRAILGQQITVAFATILAGRLAQKFGTPVETPVPELLFSFPTPQRIAACTQDEIASCGVIGSRSRAIIILSQELTAGRLDLKIGADYAKTRENLLKIPGIGPWTAEYLCMRALHHPDAFPAQDLGVLKALGVKKGGDTEALVEHLRPWRSYAVMHLWTSLGGKAKNPPSPHEIQPHHRFSNRPSHSGR
jgi:AraC family transcriptional regulator of adaptative response / DNA-3-methyladenine glycosylase II